MKRELTVTADNYGPIHPGPDNFIGVQSEDNRPFDSTGVQANCGTPAFWPAPVPAPVTTPVSTPIATSAIRWPADVVNPTEGHLVEAPIVAPAKPASTPQVKANSSFWKDGAAYLKKRLNNQSGSNAWRLFESMRALDSSRQKIRYCEAHWPTEEAAYKDIREKSKYFIDVSEMLMYATKWDRLDKLSALEDPSDETRMEREQLEKEIADQKSSLAKALPEKRMNRRDREEHAQWSNRLDNMNRKTFEDTYGMKKTDGNVRKVKADAQSRLEEQRAERIAGLKKRKATTLPCETQKSSKKLKAGGI